MTIDSLPGNSLGFLGPWGTYSEEAAHILCQNRDRELIPYPGIDAAIRATDAGEIAECIVPAENSLDGSVNITLDTLAHDVHLYITHEIIFPVRHNLLIKTPGTDISSIVSHPQALAQCRNTLRRLYPQAKILPAGSTGEAARLVAAGQYAAAVGSLKAASAYGLQAVVSDLQDSPHNFTRFIVLERQPAQNPQGSCKTSLVCKINGERPGSLCDVLQEFARRNVNMTRIESRPARTGLGLYIFFFDLEGSAADSNLRSALEAVCAKSIWYKNLGSYPTNSKTLNLLNDHDQVYL